MNAIFSLYVQNQQDEPSNFWKLRYRYIRDRNTHVSSILLIEITIQIIF